jgi:nicotinate phosphoribosyltransferase
MGIALTDTFGTRNFLEAFKKAVPNDPKNRTYAQVFPGVRQDSGDPLEFVRVMRGFYDGQKIGDRKTIVFSDSLNVGKCLKYKDVAEKLGFATSFGIGTFLTSMLFNFLDSALISLDDFIDLSTGDKSIPLNIVIKLKSAGGNNAVKISDNVGKNTGDLTTLDDVKHRLGYTERGWADGDEAHRWG